MKRILLSLAVAISSYGAYAQTNTFPSSGNVGIGITNPDLPLNLYGTGDVGLAIESSINAPYLSLRKTGVNEWLLVLERNTPAYGMSANDLGFLKAGAEIPSLMIQQSTGNVGIGTTSPTNKLDIVEPNTNNSYVTVRNNTVGTLLGAGGTFHGIVGTTSNHDFAIYTNLSEKMRITTTGNVGIGTTIPDTKLAVNGTIHSKEVKVDLTGWPDYVFKPKYTLPTLTEVKTYIDKNKRLPEMPSEQEVAKNGVNLGEIVKLQTKKIEELTLYLIDQQQTNQLQQEQIKQQNTRIAALEAALSKLTTTK